MAKDCDHLVGRLTEQYSSDEGFGSTFDLAKEFAGDDQLAVYIVHHEMAKQARADLTKFATGLRVVVDARSVTQEALNG